MKPSPRRPGLGKINVVKMARVSSTPEEPLHQPVKICAQVYCCGVLWSELQFIMIHLPLNRNETENNVHLNWIKTKKSNFLFKNQPFPTFSLHVCKYDLHELLKESGSLCVQFKMEKEKRIQLEQDVTLQEARIKEARRKNSMLQAQVEELQGKISDAEHERHVLFKRNVELRMNK